MWHKHNRHRTEKYTCNGKVHKLYCLFNARLFGGWLVTPLVTITGEVTNFAAGVAFFGGSTPSALVQVASVALGGSEAFPTVLSGLSGACPLFVTSNEFVGLFLSFRSQSAKDGGTKIDLATSLFGESESIPQG